MSSILSYLGSMIPWGWSSHKADPSDYVKIDHTENQMEQGQLTGHLEGQVKNGVDTEGRETPSLSDSLNAKAEVIKYPALSESDRSEVEARMKEVKSLYPEIPKFEAKPFKFDGPVSLVSSSSESDSEEFVLVGSSSDSTFKKPSLPSTGIPLPSSASKSSTGTSRTELETRAAEGKLVRWWGVFNRSFNGHSLVGYKEFWKAMEAFPFSHTATIFHRQDRSMEDHVQTHRAFNKAHGDYLKALEKPVKVLQSEVDGHSVEDQVKYFDKASQEITNVTWVKENKIRRGKVERDFKSTALLSMIDSIASRVISSPPEVLKVVSYIDNQLLPFARIREEREDSKDGVFAQPIQHHVDEKREIITLDIQAHRELNQYKMEKNRSTLSSPIAVQQYATGNAIYGMIMNRVLPELDKIAPKSREEFIQKVTENLAATTQLLNDALEGKRSIDANWKRDLRELSEGYDFLMWQNECLVPDERALRGSLSSHSLSSQVQGIVFEYKLMKTSEASLLLDPSNKIKRTLYLEKVKKVRQALPVLQGIVDTMGNKFDTVLKLNEALAFDPLSPDNPIPLIESDLS
ncbi:hypothetical protein [Simkania negevensis]|nr:hypothetical protein [Simkania negevensis]